MARIGKSQPFLLLISCLTTVSDQSRYTDKPRCYCRRDSYVIYVCLPTLLFSSGIIPVHSPCRTFTGTNHACCSYAEFQGHGSTSTWFILCTLMAKLLQVNRHTGRG